MVPKCSIFLYFGFNWSTNQGSLVKKLIYISFVSIKKERKKKNKNKTKQKKSFFLEKIFRRFLVFGIMKNESQVTNGFNPNTPSFPPFPCALTASIPLCCQHHHHYHCHCLHCHTNITTTPTTSATATTPLTMLPPSPPPL